METNLKKELGLLDVFCVATGAMISSGLFILPAIAYTKAGPAVILSYFIASLLVIPSMLSKAELATAMPRAGGTYFFIERSLGSMCGVFGGLTGWFSLVLKSAFAVVGMSIILDIVLQKTLSVPLSPWHLKAIGVLCCLGFTALNIVSVKHTSRFQIVLVAMLLVILVLFMMLGTGAVEAVRYKDFLGKGWQAVLATSGLVFVSFGGLTKVASIAEEVKHPGKNLPRGMLLAWFVVSLFYLGVITITVGVAGGAELSASLLPISLAASKFMGSTGFVVLSLAAIAAFVTTANGGILAASRSPLAMSRDNLLPPHFGRVNSRFKTPHFSILATGGFMIVAIVCLDIQSLIKTASTLKILLFILTNISVIAMRESRIQSYRPKFRSPWYPYIHIFAILAYSLLIIDMGKVPLLISAGFVVLSGVWYGLYVSQRVSRASAAVHIVKRVIDQKFKTFTLDSELRDILIERDEIITDRFDQLIKECEIIDLQEKMPAATAFKQAASVLAERLNTDQYLLLLKLMQREAEASTVIQPGLAIPHVVVEGECKFDVLLIRAVDGIDFPNTLDPVHAVFVLVGSQDERDYHLRALMAIAQIAQQKRFQQQWLAARDTEAIR
ncbi:MAG: amino acid permease, partial [Planctomycetes bacterium]|nr:amino acid permease [Planctomycetota bacterium]